MAGNIAPPIYDAGLHSRPGSRITLALLASHQEFKDLSAITNALTLPIFSASLKVGEYAGSDEKPLQVIPYGNVPQVTFFGTADEDAINYDEVAQEALDRLLSQVENANLDLFNAVVPMHNARKRDNITYHQKKYPDAPPETVQRWHSTNEAFPELGMFQFQEALAQQTDVDASYLLDSSLASPTVTEYHQDPVSLHLTVRNGRTLQPGFPAYPLKLMPFSCQLVYIVEPTQVVLDADGKILQGDGLQIDESMVPPPPVSDIDATGGFVKIDDLNEEDLVLAARSQHLMPDQEIYVPGVGELISKSQLSSSDLVIAAKPQPTELMAVEILDVKTGDVYSGGTSTLYYYTGAQS